MPNPNTPTTPEAETPNPTAANAKATTPVVPPADDDDAGDTGDEEPASTGEEQDEKISLTKKSLTERANRAKGKERSDILAALGVASIEEAQQAIKDAKAAELEKLSEKERLEKLAADNKKDADAAKRELAKFKQQQEQEKAETFLRSTLTASGVTEDAMDLAMNSTQKFIDSLSDDDEVTAEILSTHLAKLRKDKSLWFNVSELPAGTHGKSKTPTPTPASAGQKPVPGAKPILYNGKTAAELQKDPSEWAAYKRSKGLT